jgi:hypothetical protein
VLALKNRRLTEGFTKVEPLLIQMIEEFRDKMYEQLVKEVDLIVNEDAISFSDNLNPTFLRRVSDDFENRATKTYAKLYMDFSSQTGRAIEVFRKTLQENPSGNLNSLPLEKKKTHPMILDEYKYEYPDISAKLPEYLAKSAYIEEQTEE